MGCLILMKKVVRMNVPQDFYIKKKPQSQRVQGWDTARTCLCIVRFRGADILVLTLFLLGPWLQSCIGFE